MLLTFRRKQASPAPPLQRDASVVYPVLVPDLPAHPASRPGAIEEAREEAILAHTDALFNFARRLAGDPAVAEDLVQETMLRALSSSGAVDAPSIRAWLFRVLRNLFIDQKRRDKRSPVVVDSERISDAETVREYLRGDIEVDRLRHVVALDIERALSNLSEDHRAIILLDLEEFTEAEAAEALGCPAGTVKSRRTRARAVLRATLKEYAR